MSETAWRLPLGLLLVGPDEVLCLEPPGGEGSDAPDRGEPRRIEGIAGRELERDPDGGDHLAGGRVVVDVEEASARGGLEALLRPVVGHEHRELGIRLRAGHVDCRIAGHLPAQRGISRTSLEIEQRRFGGPPGSLRRRLGNGLGSGSRSSGSSRRRPRGSIVTVCRFLHRLAQRDQYSRLASGGRSAQ